MEGFRNPSLDETIMSLRHETAVSRAHAHDARAMRACDVSSAAAEETG